MTGVTVTPFRCGLTEPLETAAGQITERRGFLISLSGETDTGVGEATPLPNWTESHAECERTLKRASNADDVARMVEMSTDCPAARHGLTLARTDRRAKQADRPLYRQLGAGTTVETVPVNATVGDGTPTDTAAAVAAATDDGFGCCKLKVGARELPGDLERIEAVRDRVGDRIDLRLDANGAWSRSTAERAISVLAGTAVRTIEQPLDPDDLSGHAALRGQGVTIALDESVVHNGIDRVLAAESADAVVLKPMALGGIDRASRAIDRVRATGIEPIVSTTVDCVVARTAAVHLTATIANPLPAGLATGDRLAEDLAPDPVGITNGRASVPQSSGLGVPKVSLP